MILHAAMDLDKPSVWGSLKQRTRPLLINLSKKKAKKSPSKPLDLRVQHHLDRRLSLSVPDLLEAEALAPEGRPYSGPQSSYISVPNSLSTAGIVPKSSSSSLKQSEEELDWSQEEASHVHGVDTDSEEIYASPAEEWQAFSQSALDLHKPSLGRDAPKEHDVRPRALPSFLFIYLLIYFKVHSLSLGNLGKSCFVVILDGEYVIYENLN